MKSENVIGFRRELQRLEAWVTATSPAPELWSVSGIGGIGKTTLLLEIARRSRNGDLTVLWLDGRSDISSPVAWLSALETSLALEYGRHQAAGTALLPYVVEELQRQQTVLIIDHCESIAAIEGWLIARFLPRLERACILLVFASRGGLPVRWNTIAFWGERLKRWELGLLTREEVHQYLQASGLQPELQMAIAQRTEGLPLLLALTVDFIRDQKSDGTQQLQAIPTLLTADFLREAASPDLYRALTVLALLPAADQEVLNRMLNIPITEENYHALSRLSVIRVTPYGLSLHRVVARIVREDWILRSKEQFQRQRQSAFRLMAKLYQGADRAYRALIAVHTLELFREFLPTSHLYVNFSSPLNVRKLSPFQQGDLPRLLQLLRASVARSDWQSELAHPASYDDLLSDIANQAPEGLFILRDDSGVPLAFCAGYWLDQTGLRALERFAAPLIRLIDAEAHNHSGCSHEEADTICILLAAVDIEQSLYSPEELGAWLMQQWLVEMTRGFRCLIITEHSQMNKLFLAFGFQLCGELVAERAGSGVYSRWELDFRQATFPAWVERVMQQTDDTALGNSLTATWNPNNVHFEEEALTWQEVRQMLEALFAPDTFADLPMLKRLTVTAAGLQRYLQDMLSADVVPYPLTQMEQQILRASYLYKDRNKNQLAEAFHMSRASFYRHSRLALQHLAQALIRMLESHK